MVGDVAETSRQPLATKFLAEGMLLDNIHILGRFNRVLKFPWQAEIGLCFHF